MPQSWPGIYKNGVSNRLRRMKNTPSSKKPMRVQHHVEGGKQQFKKATFTHKQNRNAKNCAEYVNESPKIITDVYSYWAS